MSDSTNVKLCPACGHENSPSASFCAECDFDLMHVASELRRESGASDAEESTSESAAVALDSTATDACRLELLEDAAVWFQVQPGQSVGRGVESDVLLQGVPHQRYISRRHALFSRRGAQWFVQYAAEGNFIKVDGERYDDDSLVALYDGAVLTLSLTSFRVVIS